MPALAYASDFAAPSDIVESAREYARNSTADNTRRAYQFDLDAWALWARGQGQDVDSINETTVSLYLSSLAPSHAVATLARRVAGLNAYQRAVGAAPVSFRIEPLKSVWAGIQRMHGKPQEQKAPLTTPKLRNVIDAIDGPDAAAIRDRALLVIGFAGAMRRSDIAGLDFGAGQGGRGFITLQNEGLLITFTRSKTNQTGQRESIGIAYGSNPSTCPVRTFKAWRDMLGAETIGPVFRSVNRHGHIAAKRLTPDSVARIVKKRVTAGLIGQGASELQAKEAAAKFSGHSLRAGFVTSAFEQGLAESSIMPHTRHKKAETLYKYRRMATVFQDNPSGKVGL